MNNRQAGRRRGRGGQRQGGNPGRPDNGNRIDSRARGNAAQLLEKYKNLARDAQMSGDRVNTEYFLQFADHYFRVLSETRSRFEENNAGRNQRDAAEEGDDEDYGYEGEIGSPAAYGNTRPMQQDDGGEARQDRAARDDRPVRRGRPQRDDGNREDGNRADGNRNDGNRGDGNRNDANRNDANRGDGGRDGRNGYDRDAAEPRAERPVRRARVQRDELPSDEGNRAESGDEGRGPVAREAEPRDERPAPANDEPRRRGRPRREPVAAAEGLDAAVLPPAIGIEAAAEGEERPRRRRRVRDDEAVPPAA